MSRDLGFDGLVDWLRGCDRCGPVDAAELAIRLYAGWYSGQDGARVRDTVPMPGRSTLQALLRAALMATGRFQRGWLVLESARDGRCLAARRDGRGQARWLEPGDFANLSRPGVPVAPGEALAVSNRLQWLDAPTGFWAARSLHAEPPHPLLRVYWSVDAHHVARLLTQLLPVLDRLKCAWSLKCPSVADAFTRRDALVLYLPRTAWPRARRPLAAMAQAAAPLLRDDRLPMACALARGVAWAESDNAEQSFGQARCEVLAAALLPWFGPAGASRATTPQALRSALCAALRDAGVNPRQPWRAAALAAVPRSLAQPPMPATGQTAPRAAQQTAQQAAQQAAQQTTQAKPSDQADRADRGPVSHTLDTLLEAHP